MLLERLPEDLQPYEAELAFIVREGLVLFMARFGQLRAGMSKRSERNNAHDCMKEIAEKYYPQHCKRKGNLFYLAIGRYHIKLKKFSARLQTSSYPTQAVLDFMRQSFNDLLSLLGHEPLENLQAGYVPDPIDPAKSTLWITRPKSVTANDWEYELKAEPAAIVPPIPPATVPDLPQPGRVQPKRPTKPKQRPNVGGIDEEK